MIRRWLPYALTMLLAVSALAKTDIDLHAGTLHVQDNGAWQLEPGDDGPAFESQIGFYAPGWRYTRQEQASDVKLAHEEGSQQWVWTGTLAVPGADATIAYEQKLVVEDGEATLSYTFTPDADVPFQPHSRGLFLAVNLPAADYEGKVVKLGSNAYKLPGDNAWSYGRAITVEPAGVDLHLGHTGSISLWDQRKHAKAFQVRAYLEGEKSEDNESMVGPHTMTLRITKQTTEVDQANAISTEDRWIDSIDDYRRILTLPTLEGFTNDEPLAWLDAAAEAAKQSKTADGVVDNVRRVESWLNLHTQVADLADQLHHLRIHRAVHDQPTPEATEAQFRALLSALNEARLDEGFALVQPMRAMMRQHEEQAIADTGSNYWPARAPNPLGFVKALNLVGYAWHTGGLVPPDPRPWDIRWQDGQALSLTDAPQAGMGDRNWSMRRSWVSTQWLHGETRFTVSVLSPLTLADGITRLPLRAKGAIEAATYRNAAGELLAVDLTTGDGAASLDEMAENWLWLRGPEASLLVFVGRTPSLAGQDGDALTMTFDQKTWAAVMPVELGASAEDVADLVAVWSRVAVAPPVEVVEAIADGQATYTFVYRDQPDAFGTQARHIAPVPGLRVQANQLPDDAVRQALPGGETVFAYAPGKTLSLDVPGPKEPMRRGVNEYADRMTETRLDSLVEHGVDWVRVIGSRGRYNDRPEEQFAAFETAVAGLQARGITALIDPHDFLFDVHRDKGIPEDPTERQVFSDLWRRLATIGTKYPDTVVGYDLYNELRIPSSAWGAWDALAGEAIAAIREIDPDTPIYISGTDMSNPTGFSDAEPMSGEHLVYSFHFYAPHAFSHQKVMVRSEHDSFVFYPGWVPQIDWRNKELYGKGDLRWWDRWAIPASMYHVLSFMARNDVPMHCGEIAPIGYSKPEAAEAAGLWTRDSLDWLDRHHIAWHLWNQGFGLTIDQVANEVIPRWKQSRP